MAVLEAEGIDGSSLLGFLTAVGALRLLDEKYSGARLWFDPDVNRARFDTSQFGNEEMLLAAIVERWKENDRFEELRLLDAARKPKDVLLTRINELATQLRSKRAGSAFLTGLMCDVPTADLTEGNTVPTTLCALSGSGHQDFFVTLRDLRNTVQSGDSPLVTAGVPLVLDKHIRKAIKLPWRFEDTVPEDLQKKDKANPGKGWMGDRKPALRWDESAERLHALRFADPTKDTESFRTELGAYALAANALACLPVVPYRRGPLTVSSDLPKSGAVDFYWPLWDAPLTLPAMKVLLWTAEARHDSESAKRRGVFRWMRARRLTQDKGKLTFLPAVPVW